MPSVPIEMPSATVIVPKTWGITPDSRSAAIARSESVGDAGVAGREVAVGVRDADDRFWKAASSKPTARSIERLGRGCPPR
jgi:hypothetical protein